MNPPPKEQRPFPPEIDELADTDYVGVYRNSNGKWIFNIERQYLNAIIRPECEYTFGKPGTNPPPKMISTEEAQSLAQRAAESERTKWCEWSVIAAESVGILEALAETKVLSAPTVRHIRELGTRIHSITGAWNATRPAPDARQEARGSTGEGET